MLRAEPEELGAAAEGSAGKEAGAPCIMPSLRQGRFQLRSRFPASLGAKRHFKQLGCSSRSSQAMSSLTSSFYFCLLRALLSGYKVQLGS